MAKLPRNLGTLLHVSLNETMAWASGRQGGRLGAVSHRLAMEKADAPMGKWSPIEWPDPGTSLVGLAVG